MSLLKNARGFQGLCEEERKEMLGLLHQPLLLVLGQHRARKRLQSRLWCFHSNGRLLFRPRVVKAREKGLERWERLRRSSKGGRETVERR